MSLERVAAIVPVGSLEAAKSRLGGALDAEERRELVARLLARTLEAALGAAVADVLVVSPDREALAAAAAAGARTLRQRTDGLNAGLVEAREDLLAAGAEAVLILPIDLPFVSAAVIDALLASIDAAGRPLVALVPDRHGSGTNVLFLAPPAAIEPAFGPDSRAAHVAAAVAGAVPYLELRSVLEMDLDTPDDLLLLEQVAPEVVRAG